MNEEMIMDLNEIIRLFGTGTKVEPKGCIFRAEKIQALQNKLKDMDDDHDIDLTILNKFTPKEKQLIFCSFLHGLQATVLQAMIMNQIAEGMGNSEDWEQDED